MFIADEPCLYSEAPQERNRFVSAAKIPLQGFAPSEAKDPLGGNSSL
jgi:hypothetical protein